MGLVITRLLKVVGFPFGDVGTKQPYSVVERTTRRQMHIVLRDAAIFLGYSISSDQATS